MCAKTAQGAGELRVTSNFKTLVDGENRIPLEPDRRALLREAWDQAEKFGGGDALYVDLKAVCADLRKRGQLTCKGSAKDIFNAQAELRRGKYWGKMFRGTHVHISTDPRFRKHYLLFTVG